MFVIYLDQNAVSEIVVAHNGSPWFKIRELIESGFYTDRIICPIPPETVLESAACRELTRLSISEFFKKYSANLAFRSLADLLIDHTIAMVRPRMVVDKFVDAGSRLDIDEERATQIADEHNLIKGSVL